MQQLCKVLFKYIIKEYIYCVFYKRVYLLVLHELFYINVFDQKETYSPQ
jgi:hypothetical protein